MTKEKSTLLSAIITLILSTVIIALLIPTLTRHLGDKEIVAVRREEVMFKDVESKVNLVIWVSSGAWIMEDHYIIATNVTRFEVDHTVYIKSDVGNIYQITEYSNGTFDRVLLNKEDPE